MKSFCLALAVMAGFACGAAAAPVRVGIDTGVVVGTRDGAVEAFKGVPYAAAPTGNLRWAPPAPVAAWRSDREANTYGALCPQPMHADGTPNEGGASGATSEDCLFLNVWAPAGAKGAPVMVWLHGGGNVVGAGSLGAYEGGAFVRDGVILVTLNYRLGVLGFFAHPALTKAARPGEPLGAYGLMDQIAALEWVRRNIAAFGGDPKNVTLFGESAGGGDTLALMASPMARGLFAKAIVESGGGWGAPTSMAQAEASGVSVASKAGLGANPTVDQLRAAPVETLIAKADPRTLAPVDGVLLTQSPAQAFAAGDAAHVPMIIGSNSFEASLMATFHLPAAMWLAQATPALLAAYADEPNDQAKAEASFTDAIMGAPARWIALKASEGAPTWLYRFSYVLDILKPIAKGAGHASEIPFVFDSWGSLGAVGRGLKPTAGDLEMTRIAHACWVSFARTGVPACPPAPAWPTYSAASDTLMEFDATPGLRTHFRKAQLDAEETLAAQHNEIGK